MSERSSTTPPEASVAAEASSNSNKKRKAGEPKPVLPRNSACLNCRTRKLKCDGVHPVCTTCSKSLRYATEHLKAGVLPPPCVWEETDGAAAGILPKSKAVKRVRKSAGGAGAGATAADPTPSSSARASEHSSRTTSSQPQPEPVSYGAAPPPSIAFVSQEPSSENRLPQPMLPLGHLVDTFPAAHRPDTSRTYQPPLHPTPLGGSAALEDAHTLASLPWLFGELSRDGQETFPPRQPSANPNPPWVPLQPSYHAPAPMQNSQHPLPSLYSSTSTSASTSTAPSTEPSSYPSASYGRSGVTYGSDSVRVTETGSLPPSGPGVHREDYLCAPTWRAAPSAASAPPMGPPSTLPGANGSTKIHPIDTVISELFEASRATSSSSSGPMPSPSYFPSPPTPAKQTSTSSTSSKGKGRETGGIEGVSLPFSEQDMTAIFWPGWPPYLPAPEKMHRIIDTFFGCAHMANNIINKSKLLRNLSLPPTHNAFPHPALLHAICAVSARFLGDVYMQPANDAAFPESPTRSHHRNVLRTPGAERPTWDGINHGRGPPSTSRSGIDGDFGEIHATWASLYAEESIGDASCWMAIVQASTLLAHYYIQHAKWSAGCLVNARAMRMLTPLGLHLKDIPEAIGALFPSPFDGIEISERRNLFWNLFTVDTLSSAASAWAGMIDDRAVTQWMPSVEASAAKKEADGSLDCSQSIHAYRIFHEHTPGITSMQLMFKSILVLRRVHEFLRLTKTLAVPDAQESGEFRRLDALLSSFRQSLPAEYRSAVRYQLSPTGTGQHTLDLDTLMCHVCSLSAVIQLHETFAKVFKESDYSLLRMLAASRGIIGIVHQLAATSFDLSRLPPYASFTFFLAARCISHVLRRAVHRGDREVQAACRVEIGLLQAAMNEIGQRLPIGVRENVMCTAILKDIAGGNGSGISQYSTGEDFVRSLKATTPAGSSSNAGSAEIPLSTFDQNIDRSNALVHSHKGGELGADEEGGSHRWVEQLALEVEEEGHLLGNSLEATWTGDDMFFQTLGF